MPFLWATAPRELSGGQWLVVRGGLRAVREWEAEHGSFTDEELADADVLLDARAAPAARRT